MVNMLKLDDRLRIGGRKWVKRVAIGTWGIGGFNHKDTEHAVEDVAVLKYMLERGLNIIDCWYKQAQGFTLDIIREAMKGTNRKDVFLIAKLDVTSIQSVDDITRQVERYRRRLNVDHVDMLQICKPIYGKVGVGEIAERIDSCIDEGLADFVGLSNATVPILIDFQESAVNPIVCNEVKYSLFSREKEWEEAVEYCGKNNVILLAYQALAGGCLHNVSSERLLLNLSKKYQKSVAQIALNWLLNKPNTMCYIMSKNIAHIDEDLELFDFRMESSDYLSIDEWLPQKP